MPFGTVLLYVHHDYDDRVAKSTYKRTIPEGTHYTADYTLCSPERDQVVELSSLTPAPNPVTPQAAF